MGYRNNNNFVQVVMLLVSAVLLVMISSSTTNAMPPPTPPPKPPLIWCVANPKATEAALQNAKKLACGKVDCSPIDRPGGKCHVPDTLINHASYALAKYYSRTAECIQGAGIEVTKNPSPNDVCRYPSRNMVPNESMTTKTENAATTPIQPAQTKAKNTATPAEL